MRERHVGDADMHLAVVELPQRRDPQAVFGRLHLDARPAELAQDAGHRHVGAHRRAAELLAVGVPGVLVLEETMQVGGMRRVDPDLQRLQPVALDHALEGEGVRCGRGEAVELPARRAARPSPMNVQTMPLATRHG